MTSYDVFLWRMCLLGGFCWYTFLFRGQVPQNANFGGVNRHFQGKRAKSKMVHIIETTPPIPTKFCTTVKSTKCSSWVVQTSSHQMQDGGRPPYRKNDRSPQNLVCWRILDVWPFQRAHHRCSLPVTKSHWPLKGADIWEPQKFKIWHASLSCRFCNDSPLLIIYGRPA